MPPLKEVPSLYSLCINTTANCIVDVIRRPCHNTRFLRSQCLAQYHGLLIGGTCVRMKLICELQKLFQSTLHHSILEDLLRHAVVSEKYSEDRKCYSNEHNYLIFYVLVNNSIKNFSFLTDLDSLCLDFHDRIGTNVVDLGSVHYSILIHLQKFKLLLSKLTQLKVLRLHTREISDFELNIIAQYCTVLQILEIHGLNLENNLESLCYEDYPQNSLSSKLCQSLKEIKFLRIKSKNQFLNENKEYIISYLLERTPNVIRLADCIYSSEAIKLLIISGKSYPKHVKSLCDYGIRETTLSEVQVDCKELQELKVPRCEKFEREYGLYFGVPLNLSQLPLLTKLEIYRLKWNEFESYLATHGSMLTSLTLENVVGLLDFNVIANCCENLIQLNCGFDSYTIPTVQFKKVTHFTCRPNADDYFSLFPLILKFPVIRNLIVSSHIAIQKQDIEKFLESDVLINIEELFIIIGPDVTEDLFLRFINSCCNLKTLGYVPFQMESNVSERIVLQVKQGNMNLQLKDAP